MRDAIYGSRIAPQEVLTWHEEEARFAFQNGSAVFMRNWPYAYSLLATRRDSRVAGKFAVAADARGAGGPADCGVRWERSSRSTRTAARPTARTPSSRTSRRPPRCSSVRKSSASFRPGPALYDDPRSDECTRCAPADARRAIESATPRPVIPIWTQLSELLQIQLHRSLARQTSPEDALRTAAREMNALIERTRVRELMAGTVRADR
jgi:multiple sugar transport system substrate-binding protein